MTRSSYPFLIALTLPLIHLACTPESPADLATAEAAPAADAGAPPAGEITWPQLMKAAGITYQSQVPNPNPPPPFLPLPGQAECDGSLASCAAKAGIQYDWNNKAMVTAFEPCPALLTPISGSAEACEYHFTKDDKVYYVYRNQKMREDETAADATRCCVIDGFSLLSYRFPSYVQQYTAGGRCPADAQPVDGLFRMHAQAVSWLQTPGAGFYAYYPDLTRSADGHETSWVTPNGFGGVTPNQAFTQMVYDQVEAFPPEVAEIGLPEVCTASDVPQCQSPPLPGQTQWVDLSVLFDCLERPEYGGCTMCHTRYDGAQFTDHEPFPCCPDGTTGCPAPNPNTPAICSELFGPPQTAQVKRQW